MCKVLHLPGRVSIIAADEANKANKAVPAFFWNQLCFQICKEKKGSIVPHVSAQRFWKTLVLNQFCVCRRIRNLAGSAEFQ